MVIGIIGAMDSEVALIIDKFDECEKIIIGNYIFYKATVNNNTCILSKGGVGKTNIAICTTLLINNFNPELIINTGIAGGILPLKQYDLVLASRLLYHDVDVSALGYEKGQIPGSSKYFMADESSLMQVKEILQSFNIDYKEGIVLTGDTFVTSTNQVESFLKDEEIVVCEMEGASVAHVCHQFGVAFVSIRYISDVVNSTEQVNDYQTFELQTAKKSSEICYNILEKIN